jgi:hypothetical protein
MNIPFVSKWLKKREIRIYVAEFVELEIRKAKIQGMRELAAEIRNSIEQNHRD